MMNGTTSVSDQMIYGHDFTRHEQRKSPINANQSLWRVRDTYLACPEERFLDEFSSPYVQAVIESSAGGPLEMSSVPQGLIHFVNDMVKKFSVTPTELVSARDVIHSVFRFLDYTEPYYLLVESPVQVSNGKQLVNTYRFKDSNSVLPPDQIEVFEVVGGFQFQVYKNCVQMFEHPATKAVLDGQYVSHPTRGDRLTRMDLLAKLGKLLWGSSEFLESWVEEWMFSHYEHIPYDQPKLPDDVLMNLDSFKEKDRLFWHTVAAATLMWLKSPYSLPFLIEYHPLYNALLSWDTKSGKQWHGLKGEPVLGHGSDGLAVVMGWDIYTASHLIIEQGVPAGACVVCKQSLHCTKLINSWALVHPICDCGDPVPVEVSSELGSAYAVRLHSGHTKSACQQYQDRLPGYPRLDYVCQHCLFGKMQGLPHEVKCGRAVCPNTKCSHHMGQQAHIRALTHNRTMMLTHGETR